MFSYSIDEQVFIGDYESTGLPAIEGLKENPEAEKLWVGKNIRYTAHDFVDANYLLEKISEEAYEHVDDSAELWLIDLINNKEKCAEFKKLIGDWLETNAPVTFWSVDDIQELDFTASFLKELDKTAFL